MAGSCKRLAVEEDKLDRLTDLPINVIHLIQGRMSVDDTVKMCVLSKTWGHIWASNPKLVFGKQFFLKRMAKGVIGVCMSTNIISTILMQHDGAIKTFHLCVSLIHSSQHLFVDQWLRYLSRNGLTDLVLQNGLTDLVNQNNANAPYKLPSSVYNAELERLRLINCILRPPRGFHRLKRLVLNRVTFEVDDATCSLLMPNLESLYFWLCSGVRFLNIYAPRLVHLYFNGFVKDSLDLGPFMECGKLKLVVLQSQGEVPRNRQDDRVMKLTDIPSRWPNVSRLLFDSYFLQFLASGTEAEWLPACFTSLKILAFNFYEDLDSEDQIFRLLFILRSSPHLEELQFFLQQQKKSDMEVGINHFELRGCMTQGLNNLQKLKITRFKGSTTELRFVKFILASAPLLLKVILLVDTTISDSQSFDILKMVSRFPRASPKTEIIYEPMTKDQTSMELNFLMEGVFG